MDIEFQSTLSVGRATVDDAGLVLRHTISIHALRGESDSFRIVNIIQITISIHALRGESDRLTIVLISTDSLFQSTLSVGRATMRAESKDTLDKISIHALRGESDLPPPSLWPIPINFNPRSPWGVD